MLVLSRKAGERIHVGEDITVEVRRVAGNRVTLAIEAPRSVRILRGELEKISQEFEFELDGELEREPVGAETHASHQRVNLSDMLARRSASRQHEMVG